MSSDGHARKAEVVDNTSEFFTGTKFAANYAAKPKMTVSDQWKHFTTRGHQGRVNSCDSNANAQIIVTGGVDWSIRVWRYDMINRAFDMIAIVNIPPPSDFPPPPEAGCCQGSAPVWSQEGRQGVTAVSTLHSVRPKSDILRTGPILGGTASGSLYVLNFSKITPMAPGEEPSADGITKISLHKGPINDIGVLYPTEDGPLGGPELILISGGDDKKACLVKLRTREVPNPFYGVADDTIRHGCLFDLLFFGTGLRHAWEQCEPPRQDLEQGRQKKKSRVSEDGSLIYVEPEHCLELVDLGEPKALEHPGQVFKVAALGDNEGKLKVAFATCTEDGALLWSKTGEHLMNLRIAGSTQIYREIDGEDVRLSEDKSVDVHISMARRKGLKQVKNDDGQDVLLSQAMIFLSGTYKSSDGHVEGHVGVWGLQDGYLGVQDKRGDLTYSEEEVKGALKKRQDQDGKKGSAIPPMCIYEQAGTSLKVDQDGPAVSFGCHLQEEATVTQWKMEAVHAKELVVQPEGPSSLLLCPGREWIMNTFEHPVPVSDLIVGGNPEGPVLITGCDDGSVLMWDLEGPDAGQVISNLRSMGAMEILLPPILLLITALQMLSFSFGPAVAKHHPHAHLAFHFVVLDNPYDIDVDKADVFWFEMKCTTAIISLFLLSAFTGGPQRANSLIHMYCNTDFFKDRVGNRGLPQLMYGILCALRDFVFLYMTLCSTVLVVPLMRACASAVNCRVEDGKAWYTVFADSALESAPNVRCYEGTHLKIVALMFFMVPAFLVSVVPFAVTLGDATYVPPDCFFDYRVWKPKNAWRLAAARKAADMHRGFLAFRPRRAFVSGVVELAAKILLPVLASWMTSFPLEQMLAITAVGFMQLIVAVIYPQYLERKYSVFVLNTKVFTLGAMGTGILTVILNDPESPYPTYALLVLFSICVVTGLVQQMSMESQKPKIRIFTASGATGAADGSQTSNPETPLLAAE